MSEQQLRGSAMWWGVIPRDMTEATDMKALHAALVASGVDRNDYAAVKQFCQTFWEQEKAK